MDPKMMAWIKGAAIFVVTTILMSLGTMQSDGTISWRTVLIASLAALGLYLKQSPMPAAPCGNCGADRP